MSLSQICKQKKEIQKDNFLWHFCASQQKYTFYRHFLFHVFHSNKCAEIFWICLKCRNAKSDVIRSLSYQNIFICKGGWFFWKFWSTFLLPSVCMWKLLISGNLNPLSAWDIWHWSECKKLDIEYLKKFLVHHSFNYQNIYYFQTEKTLEFSI